ncbi:hypothetical protein WR25_14949 isoform B [Diploscapter pachys]|uniref:Arf-GAP domain-containing protein n=1 Tax=Diploscapter pachys TaxID=2018661 RepID=A0A2A2LRY9_9BILA|nr:hypothetical protein WR25_14949 isoform B [Diploscapter pachys]
MSSGNGQKKKQDERNSKLIREVAALPENKNCFECGQRGPTYVNVTEGSFCCTQCSGILRGINPPHRVKSISMAVFTNEEIEKLRRLGNAENAKTWLALYNGSLPSSSNKDALTEFLRKKYEKKAWYVTRAEMQQQETLMNEAKGGGANKAQAQMPATTTSSSNPNRSSFDLNTVVPHSQQPKETFSPPHQFAPPPPFPTCAPNALSEASRQQKAQQANLHSNPLADPFAVAPVPMNRDPFSPMSDPFSSIANSHPNPNPNLNPNPKPTDKAAENLFAAFDTQFSLKNSSTFSAFPPNGHSTSGSIPKSVSVSTSVMSTVNNAFSPFQPPALSTIAPSSLQPTTTTSTNSTPAIQPAVPQSAPSGNTAAAQDSNSEDKWSALAELDQMFHHNGSGKTANAPWVPSGFSTGVPPSSLNQPQPQSSQPNKSFSSSMPKSSTMGAISCFDTGSHASAVSGNPFQNPPLQSQMPPLASSQGTFFIS